MPRQQNKIGMSRADSLYVAFEPRECLQVPISTDFEDIHAQITEMLQEPFRIRSRSTKMVRRKLDPDPLEPTFKCGLCSPQHLFFMALHLDL